MDAIPLHLVQQSTYIMELCHSLKAHAQKKFIQNYINPPFAEN